MTKNTATKASALVYADDLHVGTTYPLGSHTLSEHAVIDFARVWDPQEFHTDRAVAAAGVYGGLIASGIHTIAICQRLAVQGVFHNWSVIAGRNIRDARFLRPVRPGDTLTGTITVEDIAFDERNRALVTTSAELVNQDAKAVLTLHLESYMHARPARVS